MKIKIIVFLLIISLLLASCSPKEEEPVPTPTQPVTPTPTINVTAEPTPAPTPTPEPTPEMVDVVFGYVVMTYDTSILVVREEADKSSDKVTKLTNNTIVEILEELDEWYKVQVGDKVGYVYKDYIKFVTATSVPVGTLISEIVTPTPVGGEKVWINVETLNIRAKPESDASIVGKIYFGDSAHGILEGEWMYITYKGVTGYIFFGELDSGRKSAVYDNGDLEPLPT